MKAIFFHFFTVQFKLFLENRTRACLLLMAVLFALTACSRKSAHLENTDSLPSTEEDEIFAVGEPIITNSPESPSPTHFSPSLIRKTREVKLSDLNNQSETAQFFIDDDIVFPTYPNQDFNDVKFHISVECAGSDHQATSKKNTIINYQSRIPLIELLPDKIFLTGGRWWTGEAHPNPICNFQFTAKNTAGDLHHFSLPQLPIHSMENPKRITLVHKKNYFSKAENINQDQKPIVIFKELGNYVLAKSIDTPIDALQIQCSEGVNIVFSVQNDLFFDLDHYKEVWSQIDFDKDTQQKVCRFIGYHKQKTTALSELFPILTYPKNLDIEIIKQDKSFHLFTELFQKKSLSQYMNDINNNVSLLALKITNHNNSPAHLWIPHHSFSTDFISFHNGLKQPISYEYNDTEDETIVTTKMKDIGFFVHEKNGATFNIHQDISSQEDSVLITIPPQTSYQMDLSISQLKYCSKNQLDKKYSAGFIFEGKYPEIYQVLNNSSPSLAEKTIIKRIGDSSPNNNSPSSTAGSIIIHLDEESSQNEQDFLDLNQPFLISQGIPDEQDKDTQYYFDSSCENAPANKLTLQSPVSWELSKFSATYRDKNVQSLFFSRSDYTFSEERINFINEHRARIHRTEQNRKKRQTRKQTQEEKQTYRKTSNRFYACPSHSPCFPL